MKTIIIFSVVVAVVYGLKGFGPGEQDWDYVTVRPGAEKFWWLYETTADVKTITDRPLVIWLQGGPGASSTGFGNFGEIGPLDENLKSRENTWVKHVNVLFIDNPVGTGYSFTDTDKNFAQINKQIALDLLECIRGFYDKRPEFKNVPLYVASESYGGKMAIEFALELDKEIKSGKITSNLKGVSLIDSWISPLDSVMNWAPFLYNIGAVDQDGYDQIQRGVDKIKAAIDVGDFFLATSEWSNTEHIIMDVAHYIDFYNVLTKVPASFKRLVSLPGVSRELSQDGKIYNLMNGPVKRALNLNITWGEQSNSVFAYLSGDFMESVTHIVDEVLATTDIKVQVVTGQLDLIVDTPGTVKWVDNLKWSKNNYWSAVYRSALTVNEVNEGYQKSLGTFSMYWVNRAGHMVPADNPVTMLKILYDLMEI